MDLNTLVCTLIAGGLLLLSFIKLSNAIEVNHKANIYFGIFVFLWSTFWLDDMIFPGLLDQNNYFFVSVRRSEEHTSELQSRPHLVCRLLLEKKKLKT